MTWFKVDDGFLMHRKTLAVSDAAVGLWLKIGCYCSGQLTDGFVPWSILPKLSNSSTKEAISRARILIKAGFLTETSKHGVRGVLMHDFLRYNPSRKAVRLLRMQKAVAGRKGGIRSGESRKHVLEAGASPLVELPSRPVPSRPDPTRKHRKGNPPDPPGGGARPLCETTVAYIKVDPASSNGMGDRDRTRRLHHLLWENRYKAKYPQNPEGDCAAAARVLDYYRTAGVGEEYGSWLGRVLDAYFDLDDKWLRDRKYPLTFLGDNLPQILAALGGA